MTTPDPKTYLDGVKFFHDTHKVVLHYCAELTRLLDHAQEHGVFASFAALPEWDEVFSFFTKDAPHHERDEERLLFPLVAANVPRVGFQQPKAPIRFLIEGHDVLQNQMRHLVDAWTSFRSTPRDASEIAESHAKHASEDAAFIALGRELVSLYRDHIATEEERVYSIADRVLSGQIKLEIAEALRAEYDNEAITSPFAYDRPQFSHPEYNIQYVPTEARGDETLDAEFEDDE